jgi:hypothetical protein
VIAGARQTGNTTLLRQLSAPWKIFDLERLAGLVQINRDPGVCFRLNPRAVACTTKSGSGCSTIG